MTNSDTHELKHGEILEIAIEVDSEAAEAVSELFNRYNGGDYDDDSEAGEASGGGAVIETTGYDDWANPIDGEFRMVVKTYVKPGERGREIRRQIEEGLWRLSVIYPMPEAQIRILKEEDWAHAWKKFYKPFRIGKRVLLKPSWEEVEILPGDIVVELDPGMAFGTGMHPSTRLCIAGLEDTVTPGIDVLDIGTGSGVLAVAAIKLGARYVMATDIDPICVDVTQENAALNKIPIVEEALGMGRAAGGISIKLDSVPRGVAGHFPVVVSNILAEVLVKLFDAEYAYPPLTEPMAPGGYLILSGIIHFRADMVVEAGERHGLTLIDRKQEGDWVALVMQKPA